MLILDCVEKKMVQEIKLGWLLAISSFVSRHSIGVTTKRGAARTTGTPLRTTEDLRVLAQECQMRLVAIDLLGLSVVIELAHPVSRQCFGQLGLLCCDTIFLCCDCGVALWVHFCVAT